MQTIKPEKIIEKISNKKTGEEYKNKVDWSLQDIKPALIFS